jgi:hypothetical protein
VLPPFLWEWEKATAFYTANPQQSSKKGKNKYQLQYWTKIPITKISSYLRSKLILYVTGKTVTILLFTVEFKTTENDNKA